MSDVVGEHADRIELRGLRVVAVVGVLPEERERAQPLEIDVDIYGDLGPAGHSDDLADTIDYGGVTELVDGLCRAEEALLLERLGHVLAEAVAGLPGAAGATVTVRKLRPPVPQDLASSAVRVTRLSG